jgi:hypothetical protein
MFHVWGQCKGLRPLEPDGNLAMPPCAIRLVAACLAAFLTPIGQPARAAESARFTMRMEVGGRFLEGAPLNWTNSQVLLLGRDGRLWTINPAEVRNYRKASSSFAPFSVAQMRDELTRELGRAYEVSATQHYLVAHPRGQKEQWTRRFEDMFRSFKHYFAVRGFEPSEPEFPLVALVFPNQDEFLQYAQRDGSTLGSNILGYYSSQSNRVSLFDQGRASSNWSDTADTIIHEVTHQTAYNTGIHRRFADTPRWLVEGLATMFEARGVWNGRQYPRQADRINAGRLAEFKRFRAARRDGLLTELVSDDRLFSTATSQAYAEAWALTFYLAEKRPTQYGQYLRLTAQKPAFEAYPAEERLRDFTAVFGNNLRLLEAQFLRFMDEL